MSGLLINDLPNEIIIKILRFLDQEDLLNATLTCKLWNDLIESSCRWSLELYHNNEVDVNEEWIDFVLATNRKFGTIKLNMLLDIDKNKTLEIFQRHGLNVVKLFLIDSCIDSFIKFAEVLKCMPNLRHVIIIETSTLYGVSDECDGLPEQELPGLSKLKTLEMVGCEYSIVKCFLKAKLTTIKVFGSYENHSQNCKPLEDFLKSQKMLTTLAFRSIHHHSSMLFRTENLNHPMPFQLTRLSLLNIRLQESPNDYNNLLRFLKPQAKTLKELELGRYFPSFVFEFVFANMTKLHTFSLMMTEIPRDKECYERLEENESVKNLIFLDSARFNDETSQFFCDFLKKLPNVCELSVLEYCGNEAFLAMAQSLSKIETISTQSFNEKLFHSVQFPNLKTLQIQELDDKIDWNEFTKAHSRLTELTIEMISDEAFLKNDDIECITSNLSLQSLRLGEYVTVDERFVEIIRRKCPNLKLFDLPESCVSTELKDHMDWNVLRLCDIDFIKCSKYSTLWNENDYDGRFPYDDEDEWDGGGGMLEPFDLNLMGIDFDWDDVENDDLDHYNYYDHWNDEDDDSLIEF